MNSDHISKLFRQAIESDASERELLLQSYDPDDRRQIERLLEADQAADEQGLFESLPSGFVPPTVPNRIRDYELIEIIGEGGMGTVYRAHHARLRCDVALKLLSIRKLKDPATVARFQREIEAVGQLRHPNIVQATDAGEENGVQYLVLDFIDGVDLSQILASNEQIGVAEACELVRQTALGLQYAHEHDLVHRDVKPSNVLVSKEGAVKVADMGLATLQSARSELTSTGQIMGTLDYIAPEQIDSPSDVGAASDLYSLGCTFYHLLCGRPPFAADEANHYHSPFAKIRAHEREEPPAIAQFRDDVPLEVSELVTQLMAKAPIDRPPSAAVVAEKLTAFATDANIEKLVADACSRNKKYLSTNRVQSDHVRTRSMPMPSGESAVGEPKKIFPKYAFVTAACAAAFLLVGWVAISGTFMGAKAKPKKIAAGPVAAKMSATPAESGSRRDDLVKLFEIGIENVGGLDQTGKWFYAKSPDELRMASNLQDVSWMELALLSSLDRPTVIEDAMAEVTASKLPLRVLMLWGQPPSEAALRSIAAQPQLENLRFYEAIDLRNLAKLPAECFPGVKTLLFTGPTQMSPNSARVLVDRFPNLNQLSLRSWDFNGVGEMKRLPLKHIVLALSQSDPNLERLPEFDSIESVFLGFSRLLPDEPTVQLNHLPPDMRRLDVQNLTLSAENLEQLTAYSHLETVALSFSKNLARAAATIDEEALAKFKMERPNVAFVVED